MDPFILLGLLVNYNKFEFQNPYRLRMDDFVNDGAIRKIAYSVGYACVSARDQYTVIQNDASEGWNIGHTLGYVGLGAFARRSPASPMPNAEEAKALLNALSVHAVMERFPLTDVDLRLMLQSFSRRTTSQTPTSSFASILQRCHLLTSTSLLRSARSYRSHHTSFNTLSDLTGLRYTAISLSSFSNFLLRIRFSPSEYARMRAELTCDFVDSDHRTF